MFSAQKSAAPSGKLSVDDVFSTVSYEGNATAGRLINTGINILEKGGIIWFKNRFANPGYHYLSDTVRNDTRFLAFWCRSDLSYTYSSTNQFINSYNTNGFTLGNNATLNGNGEKYFAWTFRKAAKFFERVDFTNPNSPAAYAVNHTLGVTPGMIMIKSSLDTPSYTYVWHNAISVSGANLYLSENYGQDNNGLFPTLPTSTQFTVATGTIAAGIAYLFADDPSPDGVIRCGAYTGTGSATLPEINLGWEPQWVMIKSITANGNWSFADNVRGMTVGNDNVMYHTTSPEQTTTNMVTPTPTGFLVPNNTEFNASGVRYGYVAIRRSAKAPTAGTDVFSLDLQGAGSGIGYNVISTNGNTTLSAPYYAPDMVLGTTATTSSRANRFEIVTRLSGYGTSSARGPMLVTNTTAAEATNTIIYQDAPGMANTAIPNFGSQNKLYYYFKRAPSFYDTVYYTGNGVAGRTISHNLGATPTLIIVKRRSAVSDWVVYAPAVGAARALLLNTADPSINWAQAWNSTAPTASVFTVGNDSFVNGTGSTFVAHLFASCPGVSSVGSYVGNGSSQTINCGFSAGARFVMIRNIGGGEWLVFDTVRGIVSANDPYLSLSNIGAQDWNGAADSIDTDTSGFIVNQVGATNANVNGATYIYLAVA